MILPFKYKGYEVELKGEISPLTSQVKFRFSNETDDNNHVLVLNTDKDPIRAGLNRGTKQNPNYKSKFYFCKNGKICNVTTL